MKKKLHTLTCVYTSITTKVAPIFLFVNKLSNNYGISLIQKYLRCPTAQFNIVVYKLSYNKSSSLLAYIKRPIIPYMQQLITHIISTPASGRRTLRINTYVKKTHRRLSFENKFVKIIMKRQKYKFTALSTILTILW